MVALNLSSDKTIDDPVWAQAGGLRPVLRDTVSVHRVDYRGRPWYLLQDALGRQQYRVDESVHSVISRLDGHRTLAEALAAKRDDGAVGSVLIRLLDAGLLTVDQAPALPALLLKQRAQRRGQRLSRWMRLLSPRLPLVDPDVFLQRNLPLLRWLFRFPSLLLGVGLMLFAATQALMHLNELGLYGAQRLEDPQSWLLLVIAYPLVKLLHELGHGFVARGLGASVHEMGVTLLVFMPVPYVDASAASVLAGKYRRAFVAAAGILVELLLSSLAVLIWLWVEDGPVREAAFAVMLIGGVSTLLFNGNPLLRFDGYYVLSDLVEIPNLATRAGRYYGYLARRYLLGLHDEASPVSAAGERPWFLAYGLVSPLYRWAIGIGIALFLVATVPSIGLLMAAWLLGVQFLVPLWRQLHFLLLSPRLAGSRGRALVVTAVLVATTAAALILVPVPSSTHADGIVLLPEHSAVRAGVEGFVSQQLVDEGATVRAGELLFMLDNPQLQAELDRVRARVAELEARRDRVPFSQRLARGVQQTRLDAARQSLQELEQRQAGLEVRSPGEGRLHVLWGDDRLGRFVTQGALLATLSGRSDARVRIVATQQDAARIQRETRGISVRLAHAGVGELPGVLLSQVPAASARLPSAALGSQAGGAIQVDARDAEGLTALKRFFAFDIAVPLNAATRFVGSRAYVRFEHAPAPLLARGYDYGRRLLLDRIGE